MQRIGTREFKNRLGQYLRQVRKGRSLVITDRGKPVAQVSPVPVPDAGDSELIAVLKSLEAQGKLRLPTKPLRKSRPVASRGKLTSRIIIEDRR